VKPSYDGNWRYEHLVAIKQQLEDMLRTGEDYGDVREHLTAVEGEIAKRRYVLIAVWDGRIVREYGRWRSEEEGKKQAEQMGLPVGADFTLGGKPFKTIVRRW